MAASLVAVSSLPGRSSVHERVTIEELSAAPTSDGFQLGPLRWATDALHHDRSLDPFRELVAQDCPGRRGLEAAICFSNVLARHFPHGDPNHEFLDGAYDPVEDLRLRMGGASGHCVTRSGLLATALLASGIHARQVQLIGPRGHNVDEVFDEHLGWVVFDPTFGTVYGGAEHPLSAASLLLSGHAEIAPVAATSSLREDAPHEFDEIVYPDPWLYTRRGARAAPWPFRGLFVDAGKRSIGMGLGQQMARAALAVSVVSLVLSLLVWKRGRRLSSSPRL